MASANSIFPTIVTLSILAASGYSQLEASRPSVLNVTCEDNSEGGLRVGMYSDSCPEAELLVFSWVAKAVSDDPRMAASLLRLHFHDCFVNGCEASVLLDDTESLQGEKGAAPNLNSLRGFEVIDAIKSDLEAACPQTVSCADILALAARDSVMLLKGPFWEAETGRRDGMSASRAAANTNLPAPNATLETLVSMFQNLGLTLTDMVALSGGHTVGKARCSSFSSRLNQTVSDSNRDFLLSLTQLCNSQQAAGSSGDTTPGPSTASATVAELDLVTPATFDNQYYVNLLSGEGLLGSDQVLVSASEESQGIVRVYAQDQKAFFGDFARAMLKMGRIGVVAGNGGEVRRNCRAVN